MTRFRMTICHAWKNWRLSFYAKNELQAKKAMVKFRSERGYKSIVENIFIAPDVEYV